MSCVVLGVIDGQPVGHLEVPVPGDVLQLEASGVGVPDERGGVFPLVLLLRLAVGQLQGVPAHHLHVVAVGPGRGVEVAHVVEAGVLEPGADDLVHHRGVDQRAVGGNLRHRIAVHRARRGDVTVEQVGGMPADHRHLRLRRQLGDGVVTGVGGGGHHDRRGGAGRLQPLQHPDQQRLAGQGHQDLARQPGGTGAGLDDDEDFQGARF